MNQASLPALPPFCSVAFKEWAVVCEALAEGRQTLILRKGGIHEGRDGFRVQHPAFWLYPTAFHQQADQLTEDAGGLLARVREQQPLPGQLQLRLLAVVDQVHQLEDETLVGALSGLHIWSPSTVRDRFHYRRPGLFLLVVRMFFQSHPHVVVEDPEMAGCKSWVDLPQPLPTDALHPVLSDMDFATRKEVILSTLGGREHP